MIKFQMSPLPFCKTFAMAKKFGWHWYNMTYNGLQTGYLLNLGNNFNGWWKLIGNNKKWKSTMKRAIKAATFNNTAQAVAQHWEDRIVLHIKKCFPGDFIDAPGSEESEPPALATFQCRLCDRCHTKSSHLVAHMALRHKCRHIARRWAIDSTCRRCLKRLHNRSCLVYHLADGRKTSLRNLMCT